jgi:uncharacterized protein
MKTVNFLIFLTIVLIIYSLVNYYIFIRGWQALPRGSVIRTYYLIIFLIASLSFFMGRFLEGRLPAVLSDIIVWIGSFWWAAMLYFFLIIIVFDLLRLINHFLPFYPAVVTNHYEGIKQIATILAMAIVAITMITGYLNATNIRIKTLNLHIAKNVPTRKALNIVAASDIHLGTLVGRSKFDSIVAQINSLHPDIVLLPGDIVDEDLKSVIRQNLGEALVNIKAPLGVYAITGNHEYIGGVEAACKYLKEHGIVVLRDSTIKIADSFYLVGREDRSIKQFSGQNRKSLPELLSEADKKLPIILLDHQPFGLEQAADNDIDLQISGHTHHGQLWPLNYFTQAIFAVSWGYKQLGQTHIYVSSGVGTWGPPMRLGNTPEIVNFILAFD